MTVQALFFDIDGTLVSFQTHVIPDNTVAALTAAKQRGVKVFISTGRPVQFIVNLHQIEHLIDGYISTSGALCYVGSHTVCRHHLLKEDLDTLLNACRQWQVPAVVCGEKSIGVFQTTPLVDKCFREGLGLTDFHFDNLDNVLRQPILQITPFFTSEQEAAVTPRLKACHSGRWTSAFTDITHVDADKGKGLLAMADYLGLPVEATMAFGDGGNDISIIRQAGIGVAMGNGGGDVKAAADYVTTSVDDDGVGNALRHFNVI
jgi:Cof subfamily protein (haloacid dehalogenase superfamily)